MDLFENRINTLPVHNDFTSDWVKILCYLRNKARVVSLEKDADQITKICGRYANLADSGLKRLSKENPELHMIVESMIAVKELEDPYALCLKNVQCRKIEHDDMINKFAQIQKLEDKLEKMAPKGYGTGIDPKCNSNICYFIDSDKKILARARYVHIGKIQPIAKSTDEDSWSKIKFIWSKNEKYAFPKDKFNSVIPDEFKAEGSRTSESDEVILTKEQWIFFIAFMATIFDFEYIESSFTIDRENSILGCKHIQFIKS